jgi:cytoskeletal protein CcmA (bactofilin family)
MTHDSSNPSENHSSQNQSSQNQPDKRTQLKDYFSDNQTPTGDHFAQWIDGCLIVSDDNVFISDDHTKIGIGIPVPQATLAIQSPAGTATLSVKSADYSLLEIGTDHQLRVDTGATFTQAVSIDNYLSIDGDQAGIAIKGSGQSQPFSVTNSQDNPSQAPAFSVDENNRVAINKTAAEATVDIDGNLRVSEGANIGGDLRVDQHLAIEGNNSDEPLLDVTQKPGHESASIIVNRENNQGEKHTQFVLDSDGRLALGLTEAKAQCHIYQRAGDTQPILRIEDNSNDSSPFLIDSEGKVGIGNPAPTNKVDISGSVRIGSGYAGEYIPDNSLVVENCIGINKLKPEAHLDIVAEKDIALRVSHADKNLLELNSETVSTDNNLHVNASVTISQNQEGAAALQVDQPGDAQPSALLIKDGNVGIHQNAPLHTLEVKGQVYVDGELSANQLLTVNSEQLSLTETNPDVATLLVQRQDENGNATIALALKQGNLGLGTAEPDARLQVAGEAHIDQQLCVDGASTLNGAVLIDNQLNIKGHCTVEHTLDVEHDVVAKSDLTVLRNADLIGQVTLGTPGDIADNEAHRAQLYITDSNYQEALRIESMAGDSKNTLVVKQGQLGVGTDMPGATLDVRGEARVSNNLEVEGELQLRQNANLLANAEIAGSLCVAKLAEFSSDTVIKGELRVDNKLTLAERLTVQVDSELQQTTIKKDASVLGDLTIDGNTTLKKQLLVDGAITTGTDTAHAQLHVQSHGDQHALIVEHKHANGTSSALLKVDRSGDVGLGTQSPQAKLDVKGSAIVSDTLEVGQALKVAESVHVGRNLSANTLRLEQGLQLNNGLTITGISADATLGDSQPSDQHIPTQQAVKTYVDQITAAVARPDQAITIGSQKAFDDLFNQGPSTPLPENCTVILLPLKNSYNGGNEIPSYQLKNSVQVSSGVSIVGYNPHTTVIAKQEANCRFELTGSADAGVSKVHLNGWTFDGQGLMSNHSGGAFYLQHAQHCQLNCHIVNHHTYGHGGGIYAQNSHAITAEFIHHCRAIADGNGDTSARSQGGAAFGLENSIIKAYACTAVNGGAVAHCHQSTVIALNCSAEHSGGGAYRCRQLRLTASDCNASQRGGAACYCSDLMCEGFWTGNNAPEGIHIYANNHQTGAEQEQHYWRGDFVGRRTDNDTRVWRADNE